MDDDEPITARWLYALGWRSVNGWVTDGREDFGLCWRRSDHLFAVHGQRWGVVLPVGHSPTTRAGLLRLMAALNLGGQQ